MCFLSLVVGLENRCDFFNKVGGVCGLWWKGEDGKNWKKELENGKFSRQYKNRENKLRKDKHGGKR